MLFLIFVLKITAVQGKIFMVPKLLLTYDLVSASKQSANLVPRLKLRWNVLDKSLFQGM